MKKTKIDWCDINIRLGVTKKDIEIITTALREYAKNHPNPK